VLLAGIAGSLWGQRCWVWAHQLHLTERPESQDDSIVAPARRSIQGCVGGTGRPDETIEQARGVQKNIELRKKQGHARASEKARAKRAHATANAPSPYRQRVLSSDPTFQVRTVETRSRPAAPQPGDNFCRCHREGHLHRPPDRAGSGDSAPTIVSISLGDGPAAANPSALPTNPQARPGKARTAATTCRADPLPCRVARRTRCTHPGASRREIRTVLLRLTTTRSCPTLSVSGEGMFRVGAGYGDLSSERAYIRTKRSPA